MSMIRNEVVDFIYKEHEHLVTRWNHSILSARNLEVYAEAINGKGGALGNCFGFDDGAIKPICPKKPQKSAYNGHKRTHAIKFQSNFLVKWIDCSFVCICG